MTAIFTPRHLSVSSVSLYIRCAQQWKQRYVDKLVTPTTAPQAWGKAFHAALEALHRGQDAELAWIAAWNAAAEGFAVTGQAFGPGKAHGLALLERFRELGLDAEDGESERKFVLPFPSGNIPVPLLGFIDFNAPQTRHYRDYKTSGGNYWNQTKVDLEPQKEAYGWAYQQINKHRAERALWVVCSTQKPIIDVYETTPSADGFRLFEKQAEAVWRGIVAQEFTGCGTCEACKPKPARAASTDGPSFIWEATP